MAIGVQTFIYPVRDLARARTVFGALTGSTPTHDSEYYVQFNLGETRLGLDPNGHQRGFTGSVGYWEVEDIRARVAELIAAGAEEHEPVTDVGGRSLIASVRDPDGNVIGLSQPG